MSIRDAGRLFDEVAELASDFCRARPASEPQPVRRSERLLEHERLACRIHVALPWSHT
ncbi:MAG: hypothetical protein P8R42_24135 [Candidatus Binatia bacterium]|nr:hypothetical protein [Candidatus Binatia bacterium]